MMEKRTEEILKTLRKNGSKEGRAGMARFGIDSSKAFGVRIPVLRGIAKETGRNRKLALALWATGWHEARILASMLFPPEEVTGRMMDEWTAGFNSWDLCDQTIMNCFEKNRLFWEKCVEYSFREEEFVKRAGYAGMARLAVGKREEPDSRYIAFFPHIERGAADERNFVKKAVCWAIRQIGKRNERLRQKAIKLAEKLAKREEPAARWSGKTALRELISGKL